MQQADPHRERALNYLRDHHVLSLATSVDGRPWVAPVFYVWAGRQLYFLSAAHTRHGRNMAINPQVAGSIQRDYDNWADIKGIQLEGEVSLLDGDARARAMQIYQRRFNLTAETAPAPIIAALDKVGWYRLRLQQLLFVDNAVAFGHRSEIDIATLADD